MRDMLAKRKEVYEEARPSNPLKVYKRKNKDLYLSIVPMVQART